MSCATSATCLLHLPQSGEGHGELLLALIVKHHDVSEILLKNSCMPKAFSAKDDKNLFNFNRIIN